MLTKGGIMIIIGHKAIGYQRFIKVDSVKQISMTKANEIVWFEVQSDIEYELSTHCKDNNISYAVKINSLREVIIYAALNAKYILIQEKYTAENAQKIADEYFFDSKIIYIINDEGSIENIAMLGIDGVIFDEVLQA